MRALIQNLRLALRHLGKTPGFTLVVVLTLALGIGSTTAIFSLVEGILLRPLPFQNADRLVLLGDHLGGNPGMSVTAREIETYSRASRAFSSVGGFITTQFELSGLSRPVELNAARVTAETFATLGVQPLLGRVFTAGEESARQPFAVISYSLWLDRFQRDPQVVGSTMDLDRKPYVIIGVMPRGFEFPLQAGRLNQSQLWIPMSLTPEELSEGNAGFWGYRLVARLKDGVSVSQAAQDAGRVARQIMRGFPANMSAIHIRGDVAPLRDFLVSEVRPLLRTLFFAVAIVLLIACFNVSGLLLVRAIRGRREYAVRLALGAGSGVIIREAILEGLLLSFAGGLIGLAFASAAIRVSLGLLPESMPRIDSISMDGTVAAFALLLALVTGVLCSLAPAFAALRTNLLESLKESGRAGSGASSHTWLRSLLVVSEVAVALVLLTVSGAFLKSFQNMRAVDPGFRPDHVLVAGYQLPLRQYPTASAVGTFMRAAVERLSNQPGMIAVGITNSLPATDSSPMAAYTIEGVAAENWKLKFASMGMTYGNYFQAMRIPLLDGRTFNAQDNANGPLVVIVNESMAKHCWPGQRAIGKRMHVGNPHKGLPWATVVGVVADTKLGSPDQPSGDQWYMPLEQPAILFDSGSLQKLSQPAGGYFTVRSALLPEHLVETFRSTIAAIDPLLALQQVRPMNDVVSNIEAPRRFNTGLITAFALGALLLAITGIYSIVAFSVSVRTQEIAIRMALGAQRTGIAKLVLISGARLALLGCGIGVLGSFAASRLVSSFLFGVSATDPLIYTAAVALMILIALLASALPAMRAANAEPIESLRSV